MKRLLLLVFVLVVLASPAWAGGLLIGSGVGSSSVPAPGDIVGARISSDGWYAEIDILGGSTGGTYDYGMTTYNIPLDSKILFSVTSNGYDDTGASTTISRTVYGTNYKRKAYPNEANADETVGDGFVTVRVALSDWVYSSDTVSVTTSSGFYTSGGTVSSAVSNVSVTNNSSEAYPKVVGNWSWPGYSRITGSDFTVRCVAFHRSARNGKSVRAVKFTATDQHSNSVSTIVTNATIDSSMPDPIKVGEYIGTLSTASLTQGDTITVNFEAYPWYGVALNTGDSANTMPTPLYAPQYYLCDKNGTYGVTVAVVDPVSGNDGTGSVVDSASFDSENPPNAFLNIFSAANAIAAYNNTNHSRNNTAAGIIYLKEGNHVWTNGTVSTGGQATGPCWTTVTKFPGTTRSNVIITSASGTKAISKHLKVEDIKITNATTIGFTGMTALWINKCDVNPTGAATFYINTLNYFTHNNWWSCAELVPYSTVNASRALIRGLASQETLNTPNMCAYTILGNSINSVALNIVDSSSPSQTIPTLENIIVFSNRISQSNSSSTAVGFNSLYITENHGAIIANNIFERVLGDSTPLLKIAGDSSTSNPANNLMIWHNTLVGQRSNLAYNDYVLNDVTPPVYRKHWSIVGNIFDDFNIVTDIDFHGGTPDNDRIGNHSVVHGVSSLGNIVLNRIGIVSYNQKFSGISYKTGTPLAPNFVNDQSLSVSGSGGGDYHLTSTSPALNMILTGMAVLPFDMDGTIRRNDGTGAIGAYEYVE